VLPCDDPEYFAPVAPGRYPFVLASHGFGGSSDDLLVYNQHLASHGYIVVAPEYPLASHSSCGATLLDIASQPGDISFLLDRFLSANERDTSHFVGRIDANAIGLAGFSFGGTTTLAAAFHPSLREVRVRAAHAIAPGACFFQRPFFGDRSVPLLLMGGTADVICPFAAHQQAAFERANAPKILVKALGAAHGTFIGGNESGCGSVFGGTGGAASSLAPGGGPIEEGFAFLAALGGPAAGIDTPGCVLPCGPADPVAVPGTRGIDITLAGGLAFFETYLKGRADGMRYLTEDYPRDHPEVVVSSELP
jgi:dienelactone hydrolase